MEREFVTYEQALALKELGFNEECYRFYDNTKELIDFAYFDLDRENSTINSDYGIFKVCTAPLIQQAFRFFREKYGLYYYIILDEDNEFYFTIYENGSDVITDYRFFTYEQAEQACLNKLIEIAKKEQTMKHELIKTENYLLVVDDSEIKEDDYVLTKKESVGMYEGIIKYTNNLNERYYNKIIAHLPLNGSPILEGVDLLPELPNEANELANNKVLPHLRAVYIEGFEKCKEKYKYTAEDMKKAYVQGGADKYYEFDKFINSLSQPKLPIAFEQAILNNEEWYNAPAAILNSSGQIVWVGEYIFND